MYEEEQIMNTIPYMKIYPANWKRNSAIQSLGYFERGVYFELLLIMHDTEGMLAHNGQPMGIEYLSNCLHIEVEKLKELQKLFLSIDCLSVTESGIIYSKELRESLEKAKQLSEKRRLARTKDKQNANKRAQQCTPFVNDLYEQNTNKRVQRCTSFDTHLIEQNTNKKITIEQSTETLLDTNPEKSASETVIPENADDTSNNKLINNNNLNINKKIFTKSARTCAREGDIEPPPGMPRDEDEAVAMGELAGIPATFIKEKAYPRILSVGYMEGKTQIRNFGQWAKLYYGNWINSQNKNKKEHEPEKKYKNYMFDDKPLPRL